MAWKTPSGKTLSPGDHVVWRGWSRTDKDDAQRLRQTPDMRYQATVMEVLPHSDNDDGECRVEWHGEVPDAARWAPGSLASPNEPRTWLYPFCFELLEDVNAIDRLAELARKFVLGDLVRINQQPTIFRVVGFSPPQGVELEVNDVRVSPGLRTTAFRSELEKVT